MTDYDPEGQAIRAKSILSAGFIETGEGGVFPVSGDTKEAIKADLERRTAGLGNHAAGVERVAGCMPGAPDHGEGPVKHSADHGDFEGGDGPII